MFDLFCTAVKEQETVFTELLQLQDLIPEQTQLTHSLSQLASRMEFFPWTTPRIYLNYLLFYCLTTVSAFCKSLQSAFIFITLNNLLSIANIATSLSTLFFRSWEIFRIFSPALSHFSPQLQWQTHTCTGRTCFAHEKRFSTTSTALPDVSTLRVLCQIKLMIFLYQ